MFYYSRFYFFIYLFHHGISELSQPIAMKLYHVIGLWLNFTIHSLKIQGPSPQKIWAKIKQNLGIFIQL